MPSNLSNEYYARQIQDGRLAASAMIYVIWMIFMFSLVCNLPFAQTSCWCKRGIFGERKSDVHLKVIYFCCCFVGWGESDKSKLTVYEAWFSAGKAAFLSGCWISILERCIALWHTVWRMSQRQTHPHPMLFPMICPISLFSVLSLSSDLI